MNIELNSIKDELENREYEVLSEFATKCKDSKGRKRKRVDDFSIRTEGVQSEEEKESLWLSTLIDKNKDIRIQKHRMHREAFIRPVADKKWQGKL